MEPLKLGVELVDRINELLSPGIDKMELEDLKEALRLGGRVASMVPENGGGTQPLIDMLQWAQEFNVDLDTLFQERLDEALWDVKEALGEQLAISILYAQDLITVFRVVMSLHWWIHPRTYELFNELDLQVEDIDLDQEAIDNLETARGLYRFEQKYMLPVVEAPVLPEELHNAKMYGANLN